MGRAVNVRDVEAQIRTCRVTLPGADHLPKDGPGIGFNSIKAIAAFDDGSVLLAGSTEGDWSGMNMGGSDFTVIKLSASGNMKWNWQVINQEGLFHRASEDQSREKVT